VNWEAGTWIGVGLLILFVGATIFQLWTGKAFNNALELLDREDHPGYFIYVVCLTSFGSLFLMACLLF
jgi:hypothetical protein